MFINEQTINYYDVDSFNIYFDITEYEHSVEFVKNTINNKVFIASDSMFDVYEDLYHIFCGC